MGHWVHVSCRRLRLPREDVMKHNSACHHEAPWAAVFEHTVGAAVAQVKQGSFSSRLQILQFGQSWKPGCSCSPALMSTCSPEIPGRMPTSLHATALSTPLCRSSARACPHAQPLLSQLGTQKTGITLGASDSGLQQPPCLILWSSRRTTLACCLPAGTHLGIRGPRGKERSRPTSRYQHLPNLLADSSDWFEARFQLWASPCKPLYPPGLCR